MILKKLILKVIIPLQTSRKSFLISVVLEFFPKYLAVLATKALINVCRLILHVSSFCKVARSL